MHAGSPRKPAPVVTPGSLPRRSAASNANTNRASQWPRPTVRGGGRGAGARPRAAGALPPAGRVRGRPRPARCGRPSIPRPGVGGRYFIPRPGWTDSEPLDGISAAGSELARWSPARWFGLRQVTAQFPRPIYPAEARGAFPPRPLRLLAAGDVMAGMSSQQGGRRPTARMPRRVAQASPPCACGSAFMYTCRFSSVR